MLHLTVFSGEYKNYDAPDLLLYYLSCDHNRENDNRQLIYFFSPNMIGSIKHMAYIMKITQQMYKNCSSGWKRVHHVMITFEGRDNNDTDRITSLAQLIACHYCSYGFLLACSIFLNRDSRCYEIHLAINSISAYTGTVLTFYSSEIPAIEEQISSLFTQLKVPNKIIQS